MKFSKLSRIGLVVLLFSACLLTGCANTTRGVGQLLRGVGEDVESWGEPQRYNHEDYRDRRAQEVRERGPLPTSY